MSQAPVYVGISACLVGQKVRYDGGHKANDFCQHQLAKHVEYLPLCPEVGIGMSVPSAPTIRLVGTPEDTRAVVQKTGEDVTDKLANFATVRTSQLDQLSGYILCAKSPSCGMERVRLYNEESNANRKEGMGIFAAKLRELYPALPMEEDGRLNDAALRENFVLRMYVYYEWKNLPQPLTKKDLYRFHARHKLLLLAHNQGVYRALGKELAQQDSLNGEFLINYIFRLMRALSKPAITSRVTRTYYSMCKAIFVKHIDSKQRTALAQLVVGLSPRNRTVSSTTYDDAALPLHVSPTHILQEQSYFQPYPDDLKLRYGL